MNIDINSYLKQIADQTRLRSLLLLHRDGELCVCELTHALGLSQPKISRHLATLRDAGVVQSRREGLWIYYSLHSDLPVWALSILNSALQGSENAEPFVSDQLSLCNMPNRPGAACCA
ncbi:MAG: metalloregulator ArsR/SmtB family transcription factor [Gammaproteobacteria bacterium]|nr:metalloregulator ArsR/SmtB family transcription factor [Gammaproteobacteria bacterium]